MSDEAASEVPMEVQYEVEIAADPTLAENSDNDCSKRAREENDDTEQNKEKRAKLESSGDREGEMEEQGNGEEEEKETTGATVGPKTFGSSTEMFDYFYKLLHAWIPYINLNKYEHGLLLELIKKGHLEAARKIGDGIKHFQIRFHPQFRSRCFFLIREDDFVEDFSFRKCVDHILPLPENMQIKREVYNKGFHGRGGGHGRGRGRVRGRK